MLVLAGKEMTLKKRVLTLWMGQEVEKLEGEFLMRMVVDL